MSNNVFFPGPIQPIKNPNKPLANKASASPTTSFQNILDQQLGVKFSKHAQDRLNHRNIQLDGEAMERLNQAVEKASSKGAKESLILMDDLALVVSIKNKTVITAVDGNSIKENVFTNIDSAVII